MVGQVTQGGKLVRKTAERGKVVRTTAVALIVPRWCVLLSALPAGVQPSEATGR